MPIRKCTKDGKSGWSYGDGTCYTGPGAKKKAIKQGLAIEANRGGKFHGTEIEDLKAQLVLAELEEQLEVKNEKASSEEGPSLA